MLVDVNVSFKMIIDSCVVVLEKNDFLLEKKDRNL